MSYRVFISYKSQYSEFARKVRDQIQLWGYETWLDLDDIPKGSYFPDEIDKGLTLSDVLVGIMTSEAFESRAVKIEWDYFLYREKPLVPLKYHECTPPPRYATIQYIDFVRDEKKGFADLRSFLDQFSSSMKQAMVANLDTSTASAPSSGTAVKPVVYNLSTIVAGLNSVLQDRLAEQALINRDRLLRKVEEFWIAGVLEKVLHESGTFDLDFSLTPNAVLKHIDYGDYTFPTGKKIINIFNDLNRELLILGAPGSGKTLLLLQLAQALIADAVANPKTSIPAVFNLSTWAIDRKPLAQWLIDELRLKYQVPKKVGQKWVLSEQLILLLDGLDEVAIEFRNECVEAINTFRREFVQTDMAICSRIADYEILTSRLDLRGALTLQPLSSAQIEHYIGGPQFSALREAMAYDSILQGMAQTPFLLNTMAYVYQDVTRARLQLPVDNDGIQARQEHLFDAYVEKRLTSSPSAKYTPPQFRHYLGWLGDKMSEFKQTTFYIDALQPNRLSSNPQYLIYIVLSNAIIASLTTVPGAIASMLIAELSLGHEAGAFALLMGAVGGAITGGLGIGFYIGLITLISALLGSALVVNAQPSDLGFAAFASGAIMGLSIGIGVAIPQRMKRILPDEIYVKLLSSILGVCLMTIPALILKGDSFAIQPSWVALFLIGLSCTLLLLVYEPINRHFNFFRPLENRIMALMDQGKFANSLGGAIIDPVEGLTWSWLKGGLGFLFAAPLGLLIASLADPRVAISTTLVIVVITGITNKLSFVDVRYFPNQRIITSLQSAILMLLVGFVLGFLTVGIFVDLSWGILAGIAVSLATALTYGGVQTIRHIILRSILYRTGAAPLNMREFLDEAADKVFLRKVGGGYIFIHRLLLEYFAAFQEKGK